jgi:parallel beta-helix repeat protein
MLNLKSLYCWQADCRSLSLDGFWRMLAIMCLVLAAGRPAAADERIKSVRVDCAAGETIAKALARGEERKPMLIVVTGTCNESVTFDRSDVTLQGDSVAGGGVSGPDPDVDTILVTGGRVTVDGLTVTGGHNGIHASGAAGLNVRNSTIQSSGRNGISFTFGANGVVDGCTIQLNPRDGIAIEAAQATVVNSSLSQNARHGVLVSNGGSARIGVDNEGTGAGRITSRRESRATGSGSSSAPGSSSCCRTRSCRVTRVSACSARMANRGWSTRAVPRALGERARRRLRELHGVLSAYCGS